MTEEQEPSPFDLIEQLTIEHDEASRVLCIEAFLKSLGFVDTLGFKIAPLESKEIEQLTIERDDARRELCNSMSDYTRDVEGVDISPRKTADKMGWKYLYEEKEK